MEGKYYTIERSIQLLISLLKQHNIKKIIASPGTTNISLVASLQQDSFFEMYSCVDERSATYMACGLAAESGEPVVLTCTGATASRNYVSGLTEAFYRKLPILAVTGTQDINNIGHHIPQVIDRSSIQNDIALLSEYIPVTRDTNDEWSNTVKINRALLELHHRGGGPVHLNLATTYSRDFSVKELPLARMINRVCPSDEFPQMPQGKIAVFIGAHVRFSKMETSLLDDFCATHDAVVLCDHTSGYNGKYKVLIPILSSQDKATTNLLDMDLLIHIGEVSGGYIAIRPRNVWRVSLDGELRDAYRKLTYVFEMSESCFFAHYIDKNIVAKDSYLKMCHEELKAIRAKIPDSIPFSNVWIASQTAHRLPHGCVLHLGILNTLRAWNYFETPDDVYGYSDTGGFGIDGCVSALIGASLAHPDRLYLGVVGDLAFFYDMNVIANRHVGRNVRIMVINNGRGTEFRNYMNAGAAFGDEADCFIAAAGHFGNKSQVLVKHYAEDLGFEYLTASTKGEYLQAVERFVCTDMTDRPILFEVFTDSKNESEAIRIMNNLNYSFATVFKKTTKTILGESGKKIVKKILNKD